jgi:DNA-binding NarL/FixJ family response regulator
MPPMTTTTTTATPTPTRIVLADDHELIRGAVRAVLEADGFEVVGEAENGSAALRLVYQCSPDAILLDLSMPVLDGLATLGRLRERHPKVPAIVLSASEDRATVAAAFELGCRAFLSKSIDPGDLAASVRSALNGVLLHPPAARDLHGLTEREAEVLQALAEGLSNREIGGRLHLTEQTIKFHASNISRALGTPNRTAAVRVAHRLGLVSL